MNTTTPTKRYMVFLGNQYYPGGGMQDFAGDFDTLDEAIAFADKDTRNDWEQIYDLTERKMVRET